MAGRLLTLREAAVLSGLSEEQLEAFVDDPRVIAHQMPDGEVFFDSWDLALRVCDARRAEKS